MLTGVLKLTDVISADSISGGAISGNVTINTNKPITTTDTLAAKSVTAETITATKFIGDGSGLSNTILNLNSITMAIPNINASPNGASNTRTITFNLGSGNYLIYYLLYSANITHSVPFGNTNNFAFSLSNSGTNIYSISETGGSVNYNFSNASHSFMKIFFETGSIEFIASLVCGSQGYSASATNMSITLYYIKLN